MDKRGKRRNTISSQKHISGGDAGRDRISNLPDCVLSQILSCLPIRDATRTCVLSKHWEFKWNLIYDVNICEYELFPGVWSVPGIVNIVERILVHLHGIRSLRLSFSCSQDHETSRMESLISALLRRNVEGLELSVSGRDKDFVVPRSLLNCTPLRTLSLRMSCIFKLPVRTCFPHLKSLYLSDVEIVNDISNTDTLILTLPVLETFELFECKWTKVKFVEIEAPLLTTFSSATPDVKKYYNYSIKIIGARLHLLKLTGGYLENFVLAGSTIVGVEIECISVINPERLSVEECGLQVRKLLRQLPNIEYLVISDVLTAIARTRLGVPLPRFRKLQKLYIDECSDAEGLLCLLHAAPYLKFLEIPMDKFPFDYEAVQSIPSCLLHHLEKASLVRRVGCRISVSEFQLEKFLLKYGLQLKTILLSGLDKSSADIKIEQLLAFPRSSRWLRIIGPL